MVTATVPPADPVVVATPRFLPRAELDRLVGALAGDGRRVIAPVERDGAIVAGEIRSVADLALGRDEESAPGRVRLRDGDRSFGHLGGPAWKAVLFPPAVERATGRRGEAGSVQFDPVPPEPAPVALLGPRACDVAAMAVQRRVLEEGPVVDADHAARTAATFVAAVECTAAGSTCFCGSMGTGPAVEDGADLVLTEVDDGFVVRPLSVAGEACVAGLDLLPADVAAVEDARTRVEAVRVATSGQVPGGDLAARLIAGAEHPRWDRIAERCLACTNCTLACPTCFCTGTIIRSDLDGAESTEVRAWNSCFSPEFARVAGGTFRARTRDRYRHWLTHKFATWWEQFGTTGCVGCGRCIAFCPVGIDVREELRFIAGVPVPDPPAVQVPGPGPAPVAALPEPALMPILAAPPRWQPDAAVDDRPAPTAAVGRIVAVRPETLDTTTLSLATDDPALLAAQPGQFVMAALPARSAPPISISRIHPDGLALTIRAAGPATTALTRLEVGDELMLRGPVGRPWPVDRADGHDVVIATGGIGLAPLRPLLDALLARRDRIGALRLYYGARTPRDRLFSDELAALGERGDVEVAQTVDRAGSDWRGPVGVVTHLFDHAGWGGRSTLAFICGPERMMAATVDVLRALRVPDDQVWVTLERTMSCGVGLCGHCQLGSLFVCRDGPVFSLAELGDRFGREGL